MKREAVDALITAVLGAEAVELTDQQRTAWYIALDRVDRTTAMQAAADLDDDERVAMTAARFADYIRRWSLRERHEDADPRAAERHRAAQPRRVVSKEEARAHIADIRARYFTDPKTA